MKHKNIKNKNHLPFVPALPPIPPPPAAAFVCLPSHIAIVHDRAFVVCLVCIASASLQYPFSVQAPACKRISVKVSRFVISFSTVMEKQFEVSGFVIYLSTVMEKQLKNQMQPAFSFMQFVSIHEYGKLLQTCATLSKAIESHLYIGGRGSV